MLTVRLELNRLVIHRPKRRWKIYFIIVAEHPDNQDNMVITAIPEPVIRILPEQNNEIDFGGEGNSEGLLLLRREMPPSLELNVHCYIRHSRKSLVNIGDVLSELETGIGGDNLEALTDILGTTNHWLTIPKSALPSVGKILQKIPDRDLGFITMFERFGEEFLDQGEIDFEKKGGAVTVVYSWCVDDVGVISNQ